MSLKRLLASGILGATGVGVATPSLLMFEGSDPYALAASILGVVLGLAIFAAGLLLYRSDVSTPHALRVAGWNVLGVVVLGLVLLLATQYPDVSLPLPIAGSILGVSAVAHILIGVTDVRRIRVGELARQRERLAVLNRLARHNLRNQAQILTSAGEVVGEHVADETGAEAAERVTASAARIATINEKLKRFQEATEPAASDTAHDVASVVTDAVAPYRESHPHAEISVDGVDGPAAYVPTQVQTAIDELLENAFEHGQAADSGVTVSVTQDGRTVSVTVADNGSGIPAQEWDVVSGDIEQSQLQHASGLGLWVVKAIVESVDGELVLSEDGTAVTLTVPRQ